MSARAVSDQRRSYVRGGGDWRLEETSYPGYYGKVKLMPPLTCGSGHRAVTTTRRIQLNCSWLGGENKIMTRTLIIALSNGKKIRLFFMLVACLERRTWSYSRIWFKSWQRKWKNLFHTCMAGLTVGLKSWLWDCTHLWSRGLVYPVPYGTGILTGNQVWVWDWRNKSHARTVLVAPRKTLSYPAQPRIYLPLPIAQHAWYTRTTVIISLWRLICGKWWGNRRHKINYIGVKIW